MPPFGFTISISKEQLSTLPIEEYDGEISVIETCESADKALKIIRESGTVGFDTETKPSFRKGQVNKVSLMQISTGNHCYLFRLNKIGLYEGLISFLEDESITKIGLSLKDDFSVLHRVAEFTPSGFIDLQTLVGDYAIADASLQKIYAIIFNRRISKSQRLSNWEASELTHSQQTYASIDAWACLRIFNFLKGSRFIPEQSPYRVAIQSEEHSND